MLRTWPVRFEGHEVDVVGQVLPGAGDAGHRRLAAELAFGADLARHPRHLGSEAVQLVDHGVHGVLQGEDLALHLDRDLRRQVALGDRGRDVGDVAHLAGQVRRHRVDRVGQVLPRAGDAGHLRLAAEHAFGADLARHPRHFRREAVELVDHRVDGFLQLEDLALDVDRDLARQVAARDRRGHGRDVAHLGRQVGRHRVDRIGQVLPRAGHPRHDGLPAEAAVGADLARDPRHLRGERAQLVDHRVGRFLELQDLAADVDGDLLRQVAVGDGDRDVGDVATCAVRLPAIWLTESVSSFQTPETPLTFAWPPSLPSVPTSRATRVTSDVNTDSCSIIVLTSLAERRNSPFSGRPSTSSSIDWPRSPLATAPMVRAISVVGRTRSSMRVLSESTVVAQPAHRARQRHALLQPALLADAVAQPADLARDAVVVGERLVERLGDPGIVADPVDRQPHREVAVAKRGHRQQHLARAGVGGGTKGAQLQDLGLERREARVERNGCELGGALHGMSFAVGLQGAVAGVKYRKVSERGQFRTRRKRGI
jgi:hypothetical protein